MMKFLKRHISSIILGMFLFILTGVSLFYILKLSSINNIYYSFALFIHLVLFIIALLIVRFGLNPKGFIKSQIINTKFVNNNFENKSNVKSLFCETMSLLLNTFTIEIPSFIFIWLYAYFGDYFTFTLIPTTVFFTFLLFWKQKGMIMFQFIYLPILILLVAEKEYLAVNILCGTVIGALIVAKYSKKIKFHKYFVYRHKKNIISYIYKKINHLAQNVYSKIYNKNEIITFQSISIFIIFLFYILGKYIFILLPPEYKSYGSVYTEFINKTKEYIPYIVFVLYVGLLMTN